MAVWYTNNGLEEKGLHSAYDVKQYNIYNDDIVIIEKYNDYIGELMMVLKRVKILQFFS